MFIRDRCLFETRQFYSNHKNLMLAKYHVLQY